MDSQTFSKRKLIKIITIKDQLIANQNSIIATQKEQIQSQGKRIHEQEKQLKTQQVIIHNQQKMINNLEEQVKQLPHVMELLTKLEEKVQNLEKDSHTSAKPPSSDFPKRNSSQRVQSGKSPGGQSGHSGKTRPLTKTPDKIVACAAQTCIGCGKSLGDIQGKITGREQVVDIPPIQPIITQYNQIEVICTCGVKNVGILPHGASGVIRIGENIRSFVSYLSATHHMPYDRLTILFADVLNLALSQGSINTILSDTGEKGLPLYEKIKTMVSTGSYRGSDETGVRVNGKTWWEWVWQNTKASYYAIYPSRGLGVVEREMPKAYKGVHIADCWCAQNNTKAKKHQLCHEHLKRDLDFLIETQKSSWAYQMYHFICKCRKARDALWQLPEILRIQGIAWYHDRLKQLLAIPVSTKKEKTLLKRFLKHKDKILTFMEYSDVPPDNNSSEQAIRQSKVKMKVSGGFRSEQGAKTYAILLSIIETCKKQHMNIMSAIQDMLCGIDISNQFVT